MADPGAEVLVARRNAPFARDWPFVDEAGDPLDLTGATARMQVRLYGAQPGSSLINLVPVVDDLTEGLTVSTGLIGCYIEELSLAFLPEGGAGDAVNFVWDLVVTLPGQPAEVWLQGPFTVKPGVTNRNLFLVDGSGAFLTDPTGALLTAG